ncbi:MAG: cell division topological specificity factor MinE [Eubacteriaceae bacterium]|jgi:septum formation topological specificity factor MinE|nr:cell division topological specificity factor MinE [Eubacteriaceae bacterium]
MKSKALAASSKDMAKERLKTILTRDRVETSKETLDSLKAEMVALAKDYFVVSPQGAEVYLSTMKRDASDKSETMLVCLLPVSKAVKNQ